MLKDDLYTITALHHHAANIRTTLHINKEHDILKGHFPGQPVLPGACMLQMVKEVLESALGKALRLKKADHLKFLSVINSGINNILELSLTYTSIDDCINITASLNAGNVVCFKMKGAFFIV